MVNSRRKYLPEIDIEWLRANYHYNAETGDLCRKRKSGGCRRPVTDKNPEGYITAKINSVMYRSHRIIWALVYGEWPQSDIDHINGKKDDNRLCNLRLATRSQNCMNSKLHSDNKSGYRGVWWSDLERKWKVSIGHKGKILHLGTFADKSRACDSYREAAMQLFGEFVPSYVSEELS